MTGHVLLLPELLQELGRYSHINLQYRKIYQTLFPKERREHTAFIFPLANLAVSAVSSSSIRETIQTNKYDQKMVSETPSRIKEAMKESVLYPINDKYMAIDASNTAVSDKVCRLLGAVFSSF